MARVALISQFYPPEPCAAANRVVAMARAFAEAGHDAHVYTAMPSFPDGRIAAAYRGRRHAIEREGDITVERCFTYLGAPGRPGNRVLHWLSVAASIVPRIALARPRFDAVVVSSPPITLALPALVASFAHRAPLFVDVRDVFPEVAVKMGAWPANGPIARIVGAVADRLYARARLVSCVTESARGEIAARGVAREKISLAPNGFDPIAPAASPPYLPLPGVRDVVFVGNMGLATGLDVVIDAAARMRADTSVRFVLIGAGVEAERLRARTRDEDLTNVLFTGSLPRVDALRALVDASATVVPLVASITDSLPTKIFDAMFVGTPIVVSASGEATWLVERSGTGLAAAPGDPRALVDALYRVLDDEQLRALIRANGPSFVAEHYDRAAVMRCLVAEVERRT